MEQTTLVSRTRKPKQYASEFEKKLMIDNLRAAVGIYGKDRIRQGFIFRKRQSAFKFHTSP